VTNHKEFLDKANHRVVIVTGILDKALKGLLEEGMHGEGSETVGRRCRRG
jgi:hypothetical protein